jgi:predicted O-methyltransferase YrrM
MQRDAFESAVQDFRKYFGMMKKAYMQIRPDFGRLLYMLVRLQKPTTIVEFGTSFGISSIYLATALHDNGGGRLITTELEPTKIMRARENLAEAGLIHLVEFRQGDAIETLRNEVDGIDFLLLDGAKNLYLQLLKMLEGRLTPNALIAADNAKYSEAAGGYLTYVRDSRNGYISVNLPFTNDNELSYRAGEGSDTVRPKDCPVDMPSPQA